MRTIFSDELLRLITVRRTILIFKIKQMKKKKLLLLNLSTRLRKKVFQPPPPPSRTQPNYS